MKTFDATKQTKTILAILKEYRDVTFETDYEEAARGGMKITPELEGTWRISELNGDEIRQTVLAHLANAPRSWLPDKDNVALFSVGKTSSCVQALLIQANVRLVRKDRNHLSFVLTEDAMEFDKKKAVWRLMESIGCPGQRFGMGAIPVQGTKL